MRRLLLVAFGLMVLTAPAAGQQHRDLDGLLGELVGHWASGDARSLVKLSAARGLELEVQGHSLGPLTGRRAAAAMRHLFSAQRTLAIRSTRPSLVAGANNRAFVELTWVVRPDGTPANERHTVFVGFVREGANWKVSQIRILP